MGTRGAEPPRAATRGASEALRLARYRFLGSLRRSWVGALALVILIGATGGAALGSLVAARDTASSYTTFLARSNASDFSVLIIAGRAARTFSHLPGVTSVTTSQAQLAAFPVTKAGLPYFPRGYQNGLVDPIGAFGNEFFATDRVAVVAGHRANPRDPAQFMATAAAERVMGWHLGQTIRFGFYTYDQVNKPFFGTAKVRPIHVYDERLVATVVFNDEVVRDSIDTYPALFLFTPAATKGLEPGVTYVDYHFKVAGGYANVPRVERELIRALPQGNTYNFFNYADDVATVNLTVRPEALALLAFGLLALLGTSLTAVQLVARRLRERREDAAVLRALGARPSAVALDALAVPLAAVWAGALVAVVVGVALSPLSVIGPVHAVLPEGFHAEWGILLGGAGLVAVVSSLIGVFLALRWAPGRAHRGARAPESRVARWGRASGLPVPVGVGLTFALEPGRGRTAVPVRSVLVGVVAAVAMVSATLTFGSGFSTLVTHPTLYGWNFDAGVTGSQDVPPQAVDLIRTSPLVAAWARLDFGDATVDGRVVPVLLVRPAASWHPALIAGHQIESVNQIVVGAGTLAALHAHLGGTVIASYGAKSDYPIYIPPRRLTIVGVATLPSIGRSDILHTSMGTGVVISPAIEPRAMRQAIYQSNGPYATLNGPPFVAVRFKPGVSARARDALFRSVTKVATAALKAVPKGLGSGDAVFVVGVQHPAQIIAYRSTEGTPIILALAFSAGIVVAFGLTVAASARRRQRDLALLKSLGLRRRQLSGAVAAQATVSIAIGLAVGVPVGVVAGRWLWGLFAQTIYAVPRETVPWPALGWLVLGALLLANAVAYPPGRSAARTPVVELLRAE